VRFFNIAFTARFHWYRAGNLVVEPRRNVAVADTSDAHEQFPPANEVAGHLSGFLNSASRGLRTASRSEKIRKKLVRSVCEQESGHATPLGRRAPDRVGVDVSTVPWKVEAPPAIGGRVPATTRDR